MKLHWNHNFSFITMRVKFWISFMSLLIEALLVLLFCLSRIFLSLTTDSCISWDSLSVWFETCYFISNTWISCNRTLAKLIALSKTYLVAWCFCFSVTYFLKSKLGSMSSDSAIEELKFSLTVCSLFSFPAPARGHIDLGKYFY